MALRRTEAENPQISLQFLVDLVRAELTGRVDAAFFRRHPDEGTWEILVVVERHADDVYQLIAALEDRIVEETGRADILFQVRARKGRAVSSVVPSDVFPVPIV
jgi:hypothetical protein